MDKENKNVKLTDDELENASGSSGVEGLMQNTLDDVFKNLGEALQPSREHQKKGNVI